MTTDITELAQRARINAECGEHLSPAETIELVEALEMAQQRIGELEPRTVNAENLQESAYRAGLTAGWNLGQANNNDGFNKCLAAHAAGIKWEGE